MNRRIQNGFTLIELSIVLVIVALLIGGIVVGREMIAAAQGRAVIKQISDFKTAVQTFRLKYACVPGDCARASTFGLGSNGNGDGVITPIAFSVASIAGLPWTENNYFWEHFVATGLVASARVPSSGYVTHSSIKASPPINHLGPMGVFSVAYIDAVDNLKWPAMYGKHVFYLGTAPDALFNPLQAMLLDQKIDDGFVSTGSVFGAFPQAYWNQVANVSLNITCYVSTVSNLYSVSATWKSCNMMFLGGF
jgi:prepilin-type N-terminal cleavage/methylation domain-containing protein